MSGTSSLFQQAIERIKKLENKYTALNNLIVVTNEEHRFLVLDQLDKINANEAVLLLEPEGKNTAPALTLAALQAIEDGQDPILVVSPADQSIQDQNAFIQNLNNAIDVAAEGSIVVFGIKPSEPNTGFGYIKKDNLELIHNSFKVLKFTEKPNHDTAQSYLESSDYFWNSGMFVMRASVWLNAIQYFSADISLSTKKAFNQRSMDNLFIRPDKELFNTIPSDSIDYAVIEKCPNSIFPIKMIELNAGWDDLGAWEAVWKIGQKDTNQNVTYGDIVLENTSNSLVYSNHKLVTTLGVNNLVIIETSDAIMIADRSHSHQIKTIIDKLKHLNRGELILHRKVSRPWGWYDNLDEGKNFKVKRIQVKPGESLSLQKHTKRAEHWVVVKGTAKVVCGNKKIILKENESTYIPLGTLHQLSNPGPEMLDLIEVQSGSYLGEDDIVRYEDSYGRV